MRTQIFPLLLTVTLMSFCSTAGAARASDRGNETDGEMSSGSRSSVVSTTPLPEADPMKVTRTRNQALEREHCMRLFEDPEFVPSCVKNSDRTR